MTGVLVAFLSSLLICGAIAYLLGMLWFSDLRNRRFRSFFVLGIQVFAWTLLNAITMVVDVQYFPVVYTLRMVFVCIVPFGVTWFILDFIGSPLRSRRVVQALFVFLPLLDVLCMVTNPLHHRYFLNYSYPVPARAPLFWIHTVVDFLFIIWVFVLLIRFIVKNARRNPILILTGVAMMVPYSLNLLYSFGMIPFPHDTTPIGFFFTLLLFVVCAYRLQLFNVKISLFSSTMDSIGDVIVLFNERQVVMDANRSALEVFGDFALNTGRTQAEQLLDHLALRCTDLQPPGLIEAVRSGPKAEGECSLLLPGGELRTYTLTWQTVFEGKKKSGHILMLTDVSSYRQMISEINQQNLRLVELKEEAEAASRSKGEFLSRMSHEMRTPMNAIIGMTQVALRGERLDPAVENALNKIGGASDLLLGVINDVLDMSKIESGKFVLAENELALADFLQSVSSVADIQAGQKWQRFSTEVDHRIPPALRVDGQRLLQVVTNLLSNAFKFTPEGGEIGLRIELAERRGNDLLLHFEVRDNGIGISAEQQSRLFRPFEQADGGISRTYGGTGLGLAISKNIVELMGGRIWLESVPGEGSCFHFTARAVAVAGAQQAPYEPDAPAEDNEFAGCHILLAEDIEINREVILALLDGSGIAFDIAENGRQACDLYHQNPSRYDMIFMDIQMPELDGLAATAAIRGSALPGAADIPIIAMTANAFREDIEACLAAGMDDHLAKPLELDRVHSVVRRFFRPAKGAVAEPQ